ncbi:Endothelial lipase [Folsomia candida]|uniref:Endothelial lipase n=2 Tax=Folsomia candida TaxID=158441 RepID=A0A226DIA3_FOLCA|nr:Endothelial lipase [Folsomia candida]
MITSADSSVHKKTSTMGLKSVIFCIHTILLVGQTISSTIDLSFDPNRIKFYLIASSGFPEEIEYLDILSLQSCSIKRGEPTIFLIHGFATPVNFILANRSLILDFLRIPKFTANFILVNWSGLSGSFLNPVHHPDLVIGNVAKIGDRIADFIKWLDMEGGVDLDNTHLIGISLGAHIAGRAGAKIQQDMGGRKIMRITGLDPAGPPDNLGVPHWKLEKNDANFVDVYRSYIGPNYDDGILHAHVDFIINNGQSEPDCNLVANVLFCNHNLAVSMFLDSMRKPYTACQCSQGELDASSFKLCMAQCPLPVVAGINARNS